MKCTVFYSWQSDLPNNTNRNFIEVCLAKAIKDVNIGSVALDVAIDRDTIDAPGAVDISKTIFDKIQNCNVFVADISIINSMAPGRKSPNPNVLIELGYASKAIGWDSIICVFNTEYGRIDDLPFDIRFRRILPYRIEGADSKTDTRRLLSAALRNELMVILQSQTVSNEILGHIKIELDREMFSIGLMIERIVYDYSDAGTLARFYQMLTLDKESLRRTLFERIFLGFQILKDYGYQSRRLKARIESSFLMKNLPQEWVNSLLKVTRVLEQAELYNAQERNFLDTGKRDDRYATIRGSDLNPENPANRFMLLERLDGDKSIVRDSGQFRQYYQQILTNKIRIAGDFIVFSDGLFEILQAINNWVVVTGKVHVNRPDIG